MANTAISEVPTMTLWGTGTVAVIAGTINTPPPTPTSDPNTPAPNPRGMAIPVANRLCDSSYTSHAPANPSMDDVGFGSLEEKHFTFSKTRDVLRDEANLFVQETFVVDAHDTSIAELTRAPKTEDARRSIRTPNRRGV